MNIKLELKKNGIEVTEEINQETKKNIANSVAHRICSVFGAYGLNEEKLFNQLLELKMYKAQMEERNERGKLLL